MTRCNMAYAGDAMRTSFPSRTNLALPLTAASSAAACCLRLTPAAAEPLAASAAATARRSALSVSVCKGTCKNGKLKHERG